MLFFEYLPDQLKSLWELWSVEFLVLGSFLFQSFLTFYGSSRRYNAKLKVRGFVWLSYLLSSKLATVILGKLTIIPVDGDRRHTHSELLALLAPMILMQIGNPDAITAYSIEDNELGVRQILSLIIQIVIVIYILVRSWTSSLTSYLYLPMFLAGIIKYGETAWTLKTALDENSGLTIMSFNQKYDLSSSLKKLPGGGQGTEYVDDANLILTAYFRFFRLKPHLENWLYQPLFKSDDEEFSIDKLKSEEIFRVTDSELGFMYDVLYTKAPIVYSQTGCILRIISFLSLIGTLCGFIALFQDVFIYHIGVGFIYFVLAASVILETYQILLLPFSDWAIVMVIRHYKQHGVFEKFLRILAPQSKRWRRWSNSLEQFNLLSFCLQDRYTKISRWTIFQYRGTDMKLRKLWNTTRVSINSEVKELIVSEMKNIDDKRNQRPFVEVGKWTMETHGIEDGDLIKEIFGKSFDKCIIIWHVATDICYYKYLEELRDAGSGNPISEMGTRLPDSSKTKQIEAMTMISNYMMYVLARKPHVLGTTTAVIVFDHAMERLGTALKKGSSELADACKKIASLTETDRVESENTRRLEETPVTKGWSLLKDVKDLAEVLEKYDKKWELIGSAWIEMMCYAASNCEMEFHSEHLWQGGELITHVWLLLAHNTNKYQVSDAAAIEHSSPV